MAKKEKVFDEKIMSIDESEKIVKPEKTFRQAQYNTLYCVEDKKLYWNDKTPMRYGFTYEDAYVVTPWGQIQAHNPAGYATKETAQRIVAQMQRVAPQSRFEIKNAPTYGGGFSRNFPERHIYVNDMPFGNAGLWANKLQYTGWYWWLDAIAGQLREFGIPRVIFDLSEGDI